MTSGHLDTLRILGSGGANRAMEAELKRLAPRAIPGYRPGRPQRVDTQTLLYPFDPPLAWCAVNYLRTPSRVLWDLFGLEAELLEPLYDEVRARVEERRPGWLFDGATVSVRVPDTGGFPAGPLQMRGTVKNAIIDGAKAHGLNVSLAEDEADVSLLLRAQSRPMVLAVDLGGAPMHERGYRSLSRDGELPAVSAPLKETVAAQLLMLARWDARQEILLDPMAGSGTIAVEGALMAHGAPVRVGGRKPPCAKLPLFAELALGELPDLFPGTVARIVANEIHTPAVETVRRSAARASVAHEVAVLHGDLRALTRARISRALDELGPGRSQPFQGLLVANPPYGQRLEGPRGEDQDLPGLYAALAGLWRELGRSFRAAFIVANPELEQAIGRRPAVKKPIWNGPIRAFALVYDELG